MVAGLTESEILAGSQQSKNAAGSDESDIDAENDEQDNERMAALHRAMAGVCLND